MGMIQKGKTNEEIQEIVGNLMNIVSKRSLSEQNAIIRTIVEMNPKKLDELKKDLENYI